MEDSTQGREDLFEQQMLSADPELIDFNLFSFRRTHKKISRGTSRRGNIYIYKIPIKKNKKRKKGLNQFPKTVAALQVLEKEKDQQKNLVKWLDTQLSRSGRKRGQEKPSTSWRHSPQLQRKKGTLTT